MGKNTKEMRITIEAYMQRQVRQMAFDLDLPIRKLFQPVIEGWVRKFLKNPTRDIQEVPTTNMAQRKERDLVLAIDKDLYLELRKVALGLDVPVCRIFSAQMENYLKVVLEDHQNDRHELECKWKAGG